MSVREWAAIWVELRRQRGREVETREWLRLWESEEEIWAELQQCDGDEGESDWESEDWGRNLGWAATVRRWRGRGRDERVIETWESEDWEWLREGFRVRLRVIFERGLKKKKKKKKKAEIREPSEPCEPVTVHRPGRSDRGPDGSMLFSHGTVPYLKWTVNLNGSRVFRSDRTVRSGFNNLANNNY